MRSHNDLVRYAWKIINREGQDFMEGLDAAERADDGRLKRILMFHGPLPTAGPSSPNRLMARPSAANTVCARILDVAAWSPYGAKRAQPFATGGNPRQRFGSAW